MNLTKKEKMALVATMIYMVVMSAGMYTLKHIYHIDVLAKKCCFADLFSQHLEKKEESMLLF